MEPATRWPSTRRWLLAGHAVVEDGGHRAYALRGAWWGSIITRVWSDVDALAARLDGLTRIGIDEISYKRGHRCKEGVQRRPVTILGFVVVTHPFIRRLRNGWRFFTSRAVALVPRAYWS